MVPYIVLKRRKISFPSPLNNCLRKDITYGIEIMKKISPTKIFNGIATIMMFICGDVRATKPKATLVSKRAAMTGAPILTEIMNIFPDRFVNCLIKELLN